MSVEALVSAYRGGSPQAAILSRERSRFAQRSPAELVRVQLGGGEIVSVFVKWLGGEEAEHPDKQRRDREPLVYRQLLAGRALPVPAFYGAEWDAACARHELVLEHVDAWSLKYHALEHWITAARRLAVLHAHFRERPEALQDAEFLLRLDGEYVRAWSERAFAAVGGVSVVLGQRLRRTVGDGGVVAQLVASAPSTLVHNDFSAKNVLADTSSAPARICFVDWEMAGSGCGLLDVAHLIHGFGPRERELLIGAYWDGPGAADAPASAEERQLLLTACELHNALYRLAHAAAWKLGRAAVETTIDEVAALRRALG
jgi:Ser/Thr protein kinase RdoA (MazF antagonist)